METLQLRLPKELLARVDALVKTGLYRTRSEIIRQAVQEFIKDSNFNGNLPFIVGPFNNLEIKHIFDMPPDTFIAPREEIEAINKKLKDLSVP